MPSLSTKECKTSILLEGQADAINTPHKDDIKFIFKNLVN